ncbi:MAG: c-type cytochrome [Bacteroidia bacterium]|nr:c-type cytochrome [Bacteroidia bacterium]
MSLLSPKEGWYDTKVSKDEKMWMVIALILCIAMFVWMILWHVYGKQNPSSITYRTTTTEFARLSEAYIKRNMVGMDNGVPVVRPEPNSDVFLLAEMWRFSPAMILIKDQSYNFHIASKDLVHGFSLQPVNMNFQIYPGYDYVLKFTPTETGEFKIVCNEFCGIGHHTMIGKIIVIEKEEELAQFGYDKFLKTPAPIIEVSEDKPLSEEQMITLGEQLYNLKGCVGCHSTDGSVLLAPSWKGLYGKSEDIKENGKKSTVVVDDAYISESIREPQKKITIGFENTMMPPTQMTDMEIQQITAFIKSIK